MTWNELKNYINKQGSDFLNRQVYLYDFHTGEEYPTDITELLCSEVKHNNSGWIPYITINSANYFGGQTNGKTEETGFR